jgi:tripartite-type tricarboxylate transporter receptor subunit TctC
LRTQKVKPLAVGSAKRLATLPDVPTAAEAGLPYEAAIWWAWATTAGTPAPVINKLNTEIAAILEQPESARRFAAESAEVDIQTPAQIRRMIPVDLAKWAKVANDAGMQKQ